MTFPIYNKILSQIKIVGRINHFNLHKMSTTPVDLIEAKKTEIIEGKAKIIFPGEATVFYNPVQEFNRDISILVLRQFIKERQINFEQLRIGKKDTREKDDILECSSTKRPRIASTSKLEDLPKAVRVLEALAASGLRSIRYAKEVDGIKEIIANDFSENAVDCMKKNIETNNVGDIVTPSQKDAMMLIHENKTMDKRFDVIDLDPYGSPAHFLDAAIQSIASGGLLMVTCTDLASLCGNTSEACFTKYGSMSLKSKACHEIALRILLHSLESHANRYGRYIEPLLCVFVDFYIRVFVRVHSGAKQSKTSCCKTSMIYQCCRCESFLLQPFGRSSVTPAGGTKYQNAFAANISSHCDHCGSRYHIAGPIWNASMHNLDFVNGLIESSTNTPDDKKLGTEKRIFGLLSVIQEELPDVPLFYDASRLANIIHCQVPPSLTIRSAIVNAGFRISSSHTCPNALKTDAPNEVLWDIMRCWAKQMGVNVETLRDQEDVAAILLKVEPKIQADFTENSNAESTSKKYGILRYQPKIQKFWGPKSKAKGSISSVNAAYYVPKTKIADEDLS